jgi:4-hydroxybenzoate polyprenyltransferase
LLTEKALVVFMIHFLFIIAITLPFDIRDYRIDQEKSLITTPQVIGIRWTKIMAIIFLLAFTLLFLFFIKSWYVLFLSTLTGHLIINSSPQKKEHYYTFLLDGTILIYFIIVKLFSA